jgi:hypothetical protein
MSDYEFTISLGIRHPRIEPAEITQTLSIEPQHSWRAGESRRGPTGELLEGAYRESYWMGRLMAAPQLSSEGLSIESVLVQTLANLRRSETFLAQLNETGGVAEVHVSIFARENFRLDLSAQLLGLFGRLGLAVALDFHPHLPRAAAAPQGN